MSVMDHKDTVHFEPDRESFPEHEGWKVSKKGDPYIRLDNGFVVTVTQRRSRWTGAIYNPATKNTIFSKRWYADERAVKLAAYDGMIMLINKRPS